MDTVQSYITAIYEKYGQWLELDEFEYIDGFWTIDGMDPLQWAEAFYGD